MAAILLVAPTTDNCYSLERVIRESTANKENEKIKKIISQLCNDYAYAVHQPHARNGGLIGLAAAAIALGPVSTVHLACTSSQTKCSPGLSHVS